MVAGLLLYAVLPIFLTRPIEPTPRQHVHAAPSASAPASVASTNSQDVAAATEESAAPQVKEEWSQEEITHGKEQCTNVLAATAAEVEMLEPVKKGECGLPAPVLLKSLGSEPKIVFDPPVEVNCAMVAALGKWAKSTLQPKARERFKSPVVRIVGASGYSCRNIYNLPNAKLSQHALANAIDIGGFGFQNGRTIVVLKGWGLTARDIKAKAEAEAKTKAGRSDDTADDETAKTKNNGIESTSAQVTQASLTSLPSKSALRQGKAAATLVAAANAADPPKPTSEAQFLRAIHDGACHEFGTVLGPEANDPHRNHFHLDLIPRRGRSYCE
jgi:hypothetical protein